MGEDTPDMEMSCTKDEFKEVCNKFLVELQAIERPIASVLVSIHKGESDNTSQKMLMGGPPELVVVCIVELMKTMASSHEEAAYVFLDEAMKLVVNLKNKSTLQ